jgi:hypothetical protein
MELRHLRYFVAVASELNFSRAAETLAVAQPAVSSQIADLEREIGTQLLFRNKRIVRLTVAGAPLGSPIHIRTAGSSSQVPSYREVATITACRIAQMELHSRANSGGI